MHWGCALGGMYALGMYTLWVYVHCVCVHWGVCALREVYWSVVY